jgi:hypothetical protein
MRWFAEKQQRYEQMHEELNEWNRALERGENPPKPEYDPDEFLELRLWEQYRLEERVQREYGVKFGPQNSPPEPPEP